MGGDLWDVPNTPQDSGAGGRGGFRSSHPGQELAVCPAVPGSQLAPSRSSPSAVCVPALRGGEARGGGLPPAPQIGAGIRWSWLLGDAGGGPFWGGTSQGSSTRHRWCPPGGGSGGATPTPRALGVLGDAWHRGWGQGGRRGSGGWHSSSCPPPQSRRCPAPAAWSLAPSHIICSTSAFHLAASLHL